MEKYCESCGRVFKNKDYKLCPYCGHELSEREGRQPIPRKLRHQVFQRDNYRCRECGATNKQTRLHVDHIIPVSKGGTNDLSNLQTLCEECNKAKYTDVWVGGEVEEVKEVKKAEKEILRKFQKEYEESLNFKYSRICPYCGQYVYYLREKCNHCQSYMPYEKSRDEEKIKMKKKTTQPKPKKPTNYTKIYKTPNEWVYSRRIGSGIGSKHYGCKADSLYQLRKKVLANDWPWETSWIEY